MAISPQEKLQSQLEELARNLWWSWNPETIRLFRDLDPKLFQSSNHNAFELVRNLPSDRMAQIAVDAFLRARVDRAHRELRDYLSHANTWALTHAAPLRVRPVAYLSAEFGLHESFPIYSGGLGVLAGDHLKSASDLGLPLVGVGLFYRESYFRQRLDRDGVQHAEYVRSLAESMPAAPFRGADGKPVIIEIELSPTEVLRAQVWQVHVGRNHLLLLDTDIEGNSQENRQLAARLYFGDQRIRIRQELLLGVGGIRALRAAGVDWGVLHLNEGHSAFATLEATRLRMETTRADFKTCAQEVAQSTVFTTHTPVDAGHDRFPPALVDEHLEPLRQSLGLSREEFVGLGRIRPDDHNEALCMTVLAFKMSRYANAVSALHGRITRKSWQVLWPHHREDEVPIGHITNGVHVRTWLATAMQDLYTRRIGADWRERLTDPGMWARINNVPDAELWETHRTLKADLVHFIRRVVPAQRRRAGYPEELVRQAETGFNPDALTIGFARRFATYKRASLILHDMARFTRLCTNSERPVQIVFAGKAHPADRPGQDVLRRVHEAMMAPELQGRIMFVEDYDINVGRHLVQGVDVWLNNPRRPQEASGTSGQKVLLNGGLNLSILDGWWAEAYDGLNGFAIGDATVHVATEEQDRRDGEALYRTLEKEVIPLYYERDENDVPRGWIFRMKRAIQTLGWRFNTDRMVMDYTRECYMPAAGASTCSMPK
ncbi:MAG TPA: alpha-glucan family phosphorylase [Polyangiaceae bacterium]|nr:alpha-glucan family phosphorylase [Polyangiaceae bacterium]